MRWHDKGNLKYSVNVTGGKVPVVTSGIEDEDQLCFSVNTGLSSLTHQMMKI